MTKIIPNSFKNARCKNCNRRFTVGEDVRWTKGDGAECVECPASTTQPAATTPAAKPQPQYPTDVQSVIDTVAQLVRDRDALTADATALRARIGEQDAEIKHVRGVLAEARSLLARTVNERDEARKERDALIADRRVGPLAQLPPEAITPAPIDDECPL
jgi:hypothetical protein